MISKESFDIDRITNFRKDSSLNKSDPAIIEKMLRALSLVEHLSESGLEFVFKGGTSLILLLDEPNRFSIDIDIITSKSREELENALSVVIEKSDFKNYKLDERRSYNEGIPKAHYKFYWTERPQDYILLDVLVEKHSYPKLIEVKVKTEWVITEEPYSNIVVPSKESILGDKLTAFAPNTIGILYGKDKELEIIKQLFDVSLLIDEVRDMDIVYESFIAFAQNELKYRNLHINTDDVLNDIFETALLLSKRGQNISELEKSKFSELQRGLRSFNNFLIRDRFRIEHAIEASSKVAWFVTRMRNKNLKPITQFENKIELKEWVNTNSKFNHIIKYKRSNRVAYYYWWNCLNEI